LQKGSRLSFEPAVKTKLRAGKIENVLVCCIIRKIGGKPTCAGASEKTVMSLVKQPNQNPSRREIIGETFSALSLPKKILTYAALFSRSLTEAFQSRVNRFAVKELYIYDLMKKAVAQGLSPKITFGRDKTRLSLAFGSGYLQKTTINLRRDGSDLHVFAQILLEREYEPLIKLIQKKTLSEEIEFIVDAGANIGLTTVYLKKFFPQAKVITVEPDAGNFALLTENVKANRLEAVNSLNAGLWQREARLEIDRNFRDHLEWSMTLQEKPDTDTEPGAVQGLSLSHIRKKFDFPRIDILKIDIEGGERFLFADDATAARTLEEVRFLALEIHDEFEIRPKIENMLTRNGFSFFEVGETVFAYRN